MERTLTIAKIAALLSITLAGLFLCYLALQGSWALDKLTNESSGTLAGVNTALETINRSCGSPGHIQPCGTLAEINKLTTHTSDLIVQTQIAVKHADQVSLTESAMLPQWNDRISQTLAGIDKTTNTTNDAVAKLASHAAATLDTANETIGAAQPVLASANVFMGHADLFMGSLSPTVQNVDRMTGDWASMSDDAKTKFHMILFPAPCKTFGCRAARVYPYVKGIAEFGEASYWTKQLVSP